MFGSVGIFTRRRVYHIQTQPQSLIQHLRNNARQQRAHQFQARVGVHLDQPRHELPIDHEIQPENLEVVLVSLGGDLDERALDGVDSDLFHPGQNLFLEIVLFLGMVRIEVLLELSVGDLVRRLILAIIGSVLLDRIVGQVDLPLEIVDVELVGGSADVAFLEPVRLEDAVDLADHHVVPDIELPLLIQEGTIDVKLHYEGLLAAILMHFLRLDDRIQFVYLIDHSDAVASVGELPWLDDPDVAHRSLLQTTILELAFLLFHVGLSLFVVGDESFVLGVFEASFDMESEGDRFEEIARGQFVVLLEVIEKCLFVAEVEVVGEVVVHSLILAAQLLQVETLLPLAQRFVPYILDALPIQILLKFRHYLIEELLVLQFFTLFLLLLFALRAHIQLPALLLRK